MRTTLPEMLWPLMESPTHKADHCFICGRTAPLEQHHIVRRGAGELIKDGRKLRKPTITLCGFGNNLRDADGRFYCHGLAHHGMLHFRVAEVERSNRAGKPKKRYRGGDTFALTDKVKKLQFLVTSEPTKYQDALQMEGWQNV